MLSPLLLERVRVWWRVARAQGKMLDGGWLFPGLNPIRPLCEFRPKLDIDSSRSWTVIPRQAGH